jgi:hypothetical protein
MMIERDALTGRWFVISLEPTYHRISKPLASCGEAIALMIRATAEPITVVQNGVTCKADARQLARNYGRA